MNSNYWQNWHVNVNPTVRMRCLLIRSLTAPALRKGDAMSRADEQLMSQLIAKVRENLSDANYNVEALAAAMNMPAPAFTVKLRH